MEDEELVSKVQELSDLELASLLCLAAQEHCIIYTEPGALDSVVHELKLITSNVFGLSHTVVDCSQQTTVDDFSNAIQRHTDPPAASPSQSRLDSYFLNTGATASSSRYQAASPPEFSGNEESEIPNVVIAKNLDHAPQQVQIQVFELLRTRRVYTRSSVLTTPKRFLFICVLAAPWKPKLVKHLNDHLLISHFHDPDDGFPNTDEDEAGEESLVSLQQKKGHQIEPSMHPLFSSIEIDQLNLNIGKTIVSMDVETYLQNIVTFIRLHRAVSGSISALATKHHEKLVRCLAPLHGLSYVTPSLVALAARKVYPHRITLVDPGSERSMQWGSDVEAVTTALNGFTSEDVIEDVLSMVDVPV